MPTLPNTQSVKPTVRRMTIDDVPGVVALQRACFPPPFPEDSLFNPSHVSMHVSIFPPGQFVAATADGQIVASSTAMLLSSDRWVKHLPFLDATGGLALTRHEPVGDVLCGIDISVHPDYRGQGLAGLLYKERFSLVHETQLWLYGTGTACGW